MFCSQLIIALVDVSLAAFGRKEIEIAEVSNEQRVFSRVLCLILGPFRMRCLVSCTYAPKYVHRCLHVEWI